MQIALIYPLLSASNLAFQLYSSIIRILGCVISTLERTFLFASLLLFLLALTPSHRTFSIDAWLSRNKYGVTVSWWSIWILRAQMEIMLVFAGLVKINADWLRLEPLGMWLARRSDAPLIGPLLEQDWFVAIASYSVIAVHLIGAPLLLFRRTRAAIIVVYFAFHLSNHFMFSIGIFPWLTMVATLLFLDPDWPKQVLNSLLRLAEKFKLFSARKTR